MSLEWMLIRGSGVAAFALLSAATIWGLLVSSKLLGKLVKAKPLTWFHESLGIGALIATVVHVVVLSIHDFLDFSWAEILVPGLSDWRPLAVALGVVSMYGLVVVAGSFYVKRWIGQKLWRSIHFASFGVFVSSLVHGMWAGTDTGSPFMIGLYLGSALVVFALLAHRLTATAPSQPQTPTRERIGV
jgi:methionine sulfoxide reductase heme-binding subunit